ncbi:MAG: response regulator transcription factor [Spirochaetes bacterium]|nr:response regulator transcription factor [Spirochaetota bacterium]MBU1078888.1 response regulator transcription factor [Spirochaetota bacterium]
MAKRIVLAEDHPLILSSLSNLLVAEPDIEIVASCSDGIKALEAATALRPDVAVLDVRMPGLTGLEVAERLKEAAPEVGVLLMTTFEERSTILSALGIGVRGFALKDIEPAAFIAAIRGVAAGLIAYHACVAPYLAAAEGQREGDIDEEAVERYGLTASDLRIVGYIVKGMSNKEIADADRCSEGTVKNRVSSILSKTGLQARTQIAVRAIKEGLV